LAETLRPRLWERVLSLARNHGLIRLCISDASTPFWLEKGFEAAGRELVEQLPASWSKAADSPWLTLKLRDEPLGSGLVDRELAVLAQFQLRERERMTEQTRALRLLAAGVVGLLIVLMTWAGWRILSHMQTRKRR